MALPSQQRIERIRVIPDTGILTLFFSETLPICGATFPVLGLREIPPKPLATRAVFAAPRPCGMPKVKRLPASSLLNRESGRPQTPTGRAPSSCHNHACDLALVSRASCIRDCPLHQVPSWQVMVHGSGFIPPRVDKTSSTTVECHWAW
jgi:hypothetical protein